MEWVQSNLTVTPWESLLSDLESWSKQHIYITAAMKLNSADTLEP
jgi:hypothetical protein